MEVGRRKFLRTFALGTGAVYLSWRDLLAGQSTSEAGIYCEKLSFPQAHHHLLDGVVPRPVTAPSRRVDVVLVGAGAAGIATAWKLKRAGLDWFLLENEGDLGGVMRQSLPAWRTTPCELGSTYFYRTQGLFGRLFHDVDVHPIETGEDALFFDERNQVADWWNVKNLDVLPVTASDKDAFRRFRDILLATPVPTYPLTRAAQEDIRAYDTISARTYVERFGSKVLLDVMDLYARSVLGAPLETIDTYALLNYYALEFGDSFQIPCYTFPRGLGAIANKASHYLGVEHVRTNALVLTVRNERDGVLVEYVDTRSGEASALRARAAIVCTQKNIAKHLIPDLPTEQVAAINKIHYAPYITIALCCNAPLFPKRAFDFWISDKQRRFTDIIDCTSPSDAAAGNPDRMTGNFVYMLSSPRPESDRKSMEDERWLVAFAQETAHAVEEHVPGALERIEEMHVMAWGHSMVIPTVGSHSTIFPHHCKPHGNIYFANSDNDLAPSVENAMGVAFEVAEEVIRKLRD